MCQAATEIVSALEDTDATFDPGMPMTSFHEPGFMFVFQTSFGAIAALRQDDPLHAQIVSQLFIRFGKKTAIAAGMNDYVPKPVPVDMLIEALKRRERRDG